MSLFPSQAVAAIDYLDAPRQGFIRGIANAATGFWESPT